MTLEELIDKTFVGKRFTCCGSTEGIVEITEIASVSSGFSEEHFVELTLWFKGGGLVELGRATEFTLTDVEVGE